MPDPIHLFHMDKKFAKNGLSMDRSIVMDYYVASDPIKPGGAENQISSTINYFLFSVLGSYDNITTVVSLSTIGYLIQVPKPVL